MWRKGNRRRTEDGEDTPNVRNDHGVARDVVVAVFVFVNAVVWDCYVQQHPRSRRVSISVRVP